MMFGMLLFWVAIGIGIYWLVRTLASRGNAGDAPTTPATVETPRAVLDRRLAAGEITVEEYDRVRHVLVDAA